MRSPVLRSSASIDNNDGRRQRSRSIQPRSSCSHQPQSFTELCAKQFIQHPADSMAYLARSAAASLRQPQRSSLLLQHLGAIRLASSTPESTASAAADKAKSAADSAKEGAKSAAESAKQTASSAADSAKQTANSAADTAKDYASKASEQGSKMLNQVSERASGLLGGGQIANSILLCANSIHL